MREVLEHIKIMINQVEKKKLLKIIGSQHIKQLVGFFEQMEVRNQHGNPYTEVFISRVFNGKQGNKKVERLIWDFAAVRMKEEEEMQRRRRIILEEHERMLNERK